MALKDYYQGSMKRHQDLSFQKPEPTNLNRVKVFCKTTVDAFFRSLDDVLKQDKLSTWQMRFMDETGFLNVSNTI